MTTHNTKTNRTQYIPIDDRNPASVRALMLARTSSPGGSADDVESQVSQMLAFIADMGWTLLHPDDPYRYVETKTGVRSVRRPVLDAVLALAQAGAVDVIVCLTPARIARDKTQRYSAIGTAQRFGCEFRFASRAATQGRYPGGMDGLLEQLKDDLFDEQEARTIAERLAPGRLARYAQGLPHGGRAGPDYGYAEGERRYKQGRDGRKGRPLGCVTWVVDEPKAHWVRWLCDTVDATDPTDLSYRKLAALLEAAGAPTATGKGHWSATQVSRMLHNLKYGAQGQNLRHRVEWGSFIHPASGEVYEEARVLERPDAERYPIAPDACPPLIAPDLWARVQAKVATLDAHPRQRFGPRRADALAHSTLLDGEFIYCRHCHNRMTRGWQGRGKIPHYRCATNAGRPGASCKRHTIAARYADPLAVKLLARALTDPDRILALADAARTQEADAVADRELAAARLASATERLAVLAGERGKLTTALAALGALDGMDAQVAAIRERLATLDAERADLDALRAQAASQRDGAADRAVFLRAMFSARDGIFDFASGALSYDGAPHLHIGTVMPPAHAAALLGVPEADIAALVPIAADMLNDGTVERQVATRDVVELMLLRLSRDDLRAVFRRLQARVLVSRPRPRAERHGTWTAPEDRVALQLLRQVEVRTDATKASEFGQVF